jgi:catechol 2,3-dioxygenase-like lactoylglutathione lyase family enzyme
MADFCILGLDHVDVTCPAELEADVVAWYRDILGLEELHKPEGTRPTGAWFKAGAQEVHVSIDEHNPPKTAHFGLAVDSFAEVVKTLRENGCHIEQAGLIPGRQRCYSRDPAGNRIEFVYFEQDVATVTFEEA